MKKTGVRGLYTGKVSSLPRLGEGTGDRRSREIARFGPGTDSRAQEEPGG